MIRPRIKRLFTLGLRRRRSWEREVEDEIMLHLSLRAEQLAARGMPAATARDEAIRRFGPLEASRALLLEAAHDREDQMRHSEFTHDLRQDIGFAIRSLRRQKGWTSVAIITLALGIAATTAVWSAASALLLHPLSYPHADRVVIVEQRPTVKNETGVRVSITPSMRLASAWRDNSRSFEALEPYGLQRDVILHRNGEGVQLVGVSILPSFVSFAGQRPLVGQNFSAQDIRAKAPVALLAEGLWRTRFGADLKVIGSSILLDGTLRRVVGVLPSSLRLPRIGGKQPDVWLPLDMSDINTGVLVVGRLRPSITTEAAQRELDSLAARSGEFAKKQLPFAAVVTSPGRTVSFRDSLLLLTFAVALVLLVACANVAHLMLARAVVRRRELAIRSALGAARSRVLRQLLTESVLLTGTGAALGVALGYLCLKLLIALSPRSLSELHDAHLDGFALLIIMGLSIACGMVFGLVAGLNPQGEGTADTLKAGAASASTPRHGERLRSLLVITEMAMSAMLLVGAALLVRSVINLQNVDLGFDATHLYAVHLDLPSSRYATPAAKSAAIAAVEARLANAQGIESMAVSGVGLGQWQASVGALEVQGEPAPPAGTTAFIPTTGVSPTFFKTIGARIVEGRGIADTSATSTDVVINAGFARRHWRGAPAVGHRIRISFQGHGGDWMTIVGVVADISAIGPTPENSTPVLYVPRSDKESAALYVRTNGKAGAAAAIMSAARSLHPELPPVVTSAETVVSGSIAAPKFIMTLLASFTALALVLACIGLYGVMAYTVAQRTREIGIRMALGASGSAIARNVITRGALLAGAGAALGLVLAYWGTRIIEGSLYGVGRLDAPSFIAGAAVLVVSAIVACVAPTRRAVAVDPILAIRAD